MTTTKLGIAIDLNTLERLMKTYVAECVDKDEQLLESVRFSTFLAWLSKRQQQQPADHNLLTFRIEKEGASSES